MPRPGRIPASNRGKSYSAQEFDLMPVVRVHDTQAPGFVVRKIIIHSHVLELGKDFLAFTLAIDKQGENNDNVKQG